MILADKPLAAPRRLPAALLFATGAALVFVQLAMAKIEAPVDDDPVTGSPTTPAEPKKGELPALVNPGRYYAGALEFQFPDQNVAAAPLQKPAVSEPAASSTKALLRPVDNQALKDEIELLEAQRGTKHAQLQVAKATVHAAERNFKLMAEGPVSGVERNKAEDEVNLARARLTVQEAELQEHEVKIRQARRRLDGATTRRAPAGYPASKEKVTAPVATAATGLATALDRAPLALQPKPLPEVKDELKFLVKLGLDLKEKRAQLEDNIKKLQQQQADIEEALRKLNAKLDEIKKRSSDPASRP